jgi:O-antigen/teichoic acid export membrane protein
MLYPLLLIRSAFAAIGEAHVTAWISVVQALSLIIFMTVGYWLGGPLGAIYGGAISKIIPSIAVLALAYRKRWTRPLKELRWLPACGVGLAAGMLSTYVVGTHTLADLRRFSGF